MANYAERFQKAIDLANMNHENNIAEVQKMAEEIMETLLSNIEAKVLKGNCSAMSIYFMSGQKVERYSSIIGLSGRESMERLLKDLLDLLKGASTTPDLSIDPVGDQYAITLRIP